MTAAAAAIMASICVSCSVLAGLTDDLALKLSESSFGQMSFSQTVRDPDDRLTSSTGKLAYSRPAKFALEYDSPEQVKMVSDGQTLWVHDIDLNQVVVTDLSEAPGNHGFLSVLGATDLTSEFDLDSYEDGEISWLVLVPHDEESVSFTSCDIGFNASGEIVAARFTDLVGNEVDARFFDVEASAPSAGRFSFEPPDGAEVIHQRR